MKNVLKITLLVLLGFSFAITACKKNKDKAPGDILLAVGKWKPTKIEYRQGNSSTWTIEPVEPCHADDINTFIADGTGTFDEGPTKCASYEPQSRTGTWSVSSDGKKLTVTEVWTSFEGDIEEISESKLVVIGYNVMGSGEDYRLTFQPR